MIERKARDLSNGDTATVVLNSKNGSSVEPVLVSILKVKHSTRQPRNPSIIVDVLTDTSRHHGLGNLVLGGGTKVVD